MSEETRRVATRPMPLRAMQWELPRWRVEGAAASPTIDCFDHAVMHGAKAVGKLAGLCDDADHRAAEHDADDAEGRTSAGDPTVRSAVFAAPEEVARYAADLVVVALKLAQTCPSGAFDLEAAVVARVREKNAPGTFPSADFTPEREQHPQGETSPMTPTQLGERGDTR